MTTGDAASAERARRFAATAAVIGCALVLAVIVASAYLRLSQAGPGWSGITGFARIVHRLAASAEALLVVMIAGRVLGSAPAVDRRSAYRRIDRCADRLPRPAWHRDC